MEHRTFIADDGSTWEIWVVDPHAVERRSADGGGTGPVGNERRTGRGLVVPTGLEDGWLAFQSGSQRRRLFPVPSGWERFDEPQLRALLRDSAPVTDRRSGDGPVVPER